MREHNTVVHVLLDLLINSDENGSTRNVCVEVRVQHFETQQIVWQALLRFVRILQHKADHGHVKHALVVPVSASLEIDQRHSLFVGFHDVQLH